MIITTRQIVLKEGPTSLWLTYHGSAQTLSSEALTAIETAFRRTTEHHVRIHPITRAEAQTAASRIAQHLKELFRETYPWVNHLRVELT